MNNKVEEKYHSNGQILWKRYTNEQGQLHREDGPAYTYWDEKGQKIFEWFYLNGQLHRTDGPARTEWHKSGQKLSEQYWVNNNLHREDGPALIRWYTNGKLRSEDHCLNGKRKSRKFLSEPKQLVVVTSFNDVVEIKVNGQSATIAEAVSFLNSLQN